MPTSYAFFDFDGTLIGGDSIILFMRYAWRHKLCSAVDLLRFLVAGGLFTLNVYSPKRAKEMALHFVKGRERAAYQSAAEDFCRSVLVPRLYSQGVDTVKKHLAAGDTVLLVSASPAFYLEPLQDILGFAHVLGTQLAVDEAGRFTGAIIGQNCRGEQKNVRIAQYLAETGTQLDFETSCAYGDSTHDLPMLGLVRHGYAVNPGKKMQTKLQSQGDVTVVRWKG